MVQAEKVTARGKFPGTAICHVTLSSCKQNQQTEGFSHVDKLSEEASSIGPRGKKMVVKKKEGRGLGQVGQRELPEIR